MKTPVELFGIECGPGWFKLIDPLISRCKKEGATILQIKEKFGTLRFYVAGASEELEDAIWEAEKASSGICEECGEAGSLRNGGWFKTLCEKHAEDREPLKL